MKTGLGKVEAAISNPESLDLRRHLSAELLMDVGGCNSAAEYKSCHEADETNELTERELIDRLV